MASWSLDAFRNWRSTFMDALYWGKPKQFIPGIDSLGPPVRRIKALFAELALEVETVSKKLTILPVVHLFGFTWQLSPIGAEFLGEKTSVAIAPSATWLVAARKTPWTGTGKRNAWIGSAQSTDGTLVAMRQQVSHHLASHDFSFSDSAAPTDFNGSEIAFIAAHGGTGMGDHFRPDRICDRGVLQPCAATASRHARMAMFPPEFDSRTLILHGDDDQIVPIADSALLSAKLVKNSTLKVYPGAPHGMCTTRKNKVNEDLWIPSGRSSWYLPATVTSPLLSLPMPRKLR